MDSYATIRRSALIATIGVWVLSAACINLKLEPISNNNGGHCADATNGASSGDADCDSDGGTIGMGGIGGMGGTGAMGSAGTGATGGAGTGAMGGVGGVGASGGSGGGGTGTSLPVLGGSFNRSNNSAFPAAVSNFSLDMTEVTVGRFRSFVDAGFGTSTSAPANGAGTHPLIMGSGWITAWNAELASDTATLRNSLHCDSTFQTWTDATGSNENLPINCVTWFEAFAFCVWDGGRFPTEAEWNYAAAGGNEQREFPWGAMVDSTKASYLCIADGSSPQDCSAKDILAVGARPAGNAKWGHTDLAGNMWEWVLDKSASYTLPCNDCANLANGSDRIARGGSFGETEGNITSGVRFAELPGNRFPTIGFRCARD